MTSMIAVGLILSASVDPQRFRVPELLQPGRFIYEVSHATEHRFQYPRGKNAIGAPDRARKLDHVILGDVRLGIKPDSLIKDSVPGGVWIAGRTMREGEASWRLASSLETTAAGGRTESKKLPVGGPPLRQTWPWGNVAIDERLPQTHLPILMGLLPSIGPKLFDHTDPGFDDKPREVGQQVLTGFLNAALPAADWKVTASKQGDRWIVKGVLSERRPAGVMEGSFSSLASKELIVNDVYIRRVERVETQAEWVEEWDARRQVLLRRRAQLKIELTNASGHWDVQRTRIPDKEFEYKEVWTETLDQKLRTAATNSFLDALSTPGPISPDQVYALAFLSELSYHFALDAGRLRVDLKRATPENLVKAHTVLAGLSLDAMTEEGAKRVLSVSGVHAKSRDFLPAGAAESGDLLLVEFPEFLVLAFRGTEGMTLRGGADWLRNLEVGPMVPWWTEGQAGGAVMASGFGSALMGFRGYLPYLLNQLGAKGKPIWLTGHSQGGALASLAAPWLKAEGHTIAGIATFGAPRPGNRAMAAQIEASVPPGRAIRVAAERDPVPFLPATGRGQSRDWVWRTIFQADPPGTWLGFDPAHPFPGMRFLFSGPAGSSLIRTAQLESEVGREATDDGGTLEVGSHFVNRYVQDVAVWMRLRGGRLDPRPFFPLGED